MKRLYTILLTTVASITVPVFLGTLVTTGGFAADELASVKVERLAPASLKADASCHDPCDDPFKLKAWVRDESASGVEGVRVTFSFKLRSGVVEGQAITNAQGYAHFHQKLTPSMAPSTRPVNDGTEFANVARPGIAHQ